jgi:hypothetical protein
LFVIHFPELLLGLATEFCSEKIPWNGFRSSTEESAQSDVYGRVNSEARNRRKWHEKNLFNKKSCSSKQNVFVGDSFGMEFREFASIFVPTNGIPSCFLFRQIAWNRIPGVCFYFGSTEPNTKLFSLWRNGSERNTESLLLFLSYGTEFRAFFSSAERFGMEF